MQNCPDVTILNFFLVVFFFLYFCLFCLFVFFIFFSLFLPFCLFSIPHGDQMLKVTLWIKILKWHWPTDPLIHSVTKGRYRAERAAKTKSQHKNKNESDVKNKKYKKEIGDDKNAVSVPTPTSPYSQSVLAGNREGDWQNTLIKVCNNSVLII